jgi:hypothetical protein
MAQAIILELQTLTALRVTEQYLPEWLESPQNRPLFPYSTEGFPDLSNHSVEVVEDLLRRKATSVKTTDPLKMHRKKKHARSPSSYCPSRSRSDSGATELMKLSKTREGMVV